MDDYFRKQLSAETLSLVDDIEQALQQSIELEHQPERRKFACTFESKQPRILAPTLDNLPEGSIIHELLHLKRWSIEGVKRLVASDSYFERDNDILTLDNAIEHIFILPEEIQRYPRRSGYWENTLQIKLRAVKKSKAPESDILGHCILCCAQARRATRSISLHNGWKNYLVKSGRQRVVNRHLEKIFTAKSKDVIVDLMVSVLEIPQEAIEQI